MRKCSYLLPLLLALTLLAGCGGDPAPAEPEVLPEEEETISLPEPPRRL